MKRTLIAFALLVLPVLAFGQTLDRDTLLTPDGTLYTIGSVAADGSNPLITSSQYLVLTVQQTASSATLAVPASLTGGVHSSPALAYDYDSGTLFIFWEQEISNRQRTTSLLFTSFQGGKFSGVTEIDAENYRYRHNLRIGVTRKTQDLDKPGQPFYNELNVHVIWWETGVGEWARYAMLTIENGNVTSTLIRNMSDLADPTQSGGDPFTVGGDFNFDVLRHPQVFESSAHDSVDFVYGDFDSHGLNRLTVKPVVQSRIRIPIGVRDNRFPAPAMGSNSVTTSLSAVSSDHGLVFFTSTGGAVSYSLYKDGSWSAVRSIALNDKVTTDVAVNALRRLVSD
jgi:hypothetical protein